MYHCDYKIVISGLDSEIYEYVKNNSAELFGSHFDITVEKADKLNGKHFAEANAIFAEITENIDDILLMYAVNKKDKSSLIVMASPAERAKIFKNENKSLITDLWSYGIEKENFIFKYERFIKNELLKADKWLTETYLENVIDSTDDLIWFKDKIGIHLKVNDSFCKAVNKTKEQVSGRGHYYIWNITPEEYVTGEYVCMESEYEVMRKREKCWFDEDVLINGEKRKLLTCKSPLFDLDGSVMGTVGVAKDVTREYEYKARLEAELSKAKEAIDIDTNTGLYNREAFVNDMSHVTDIFDLENFVFISVDINGLKASNDKYGPMAGDELVKATALCMINCFGAYGRLYRVGGDEFFAMLNADEHDMNRMTRDFENMMYNWSGEYAKELSVSYGYVISDLRFVENLYDVVKEADTRMFEAKNTYYQRKGLDRRSKQELIEVLTASYLKVLKVNLSSDACMSIKVDANELTVEAGYDERLSEWTKNLASHGYIYDDDKESFVENTDIVKLRNIFKNGAGHYEVRYRRKVDSDEFRRVLLEMVPAKEYSDDNQIIYLYVKIIG